MPKIRLTKNELKTQRENLKRFQRYLPTLQLKKQQLQLEVRRVRDAVTQLESEAAQGRADVRGWIQLLDPAERPALQELVTVAAWKTDVRNIAGTDIPVFLSLEFAVRPCDLFSTPAWFDEAVAAARQLIELALRRRILEEQQALLEQELRVTSQRVNLFEKVKIPAADENIRVIQIYLGDQLANAVGRAKIAKTKCNARDLSVAAEI